MTLERIFTNSPAYTTCGTTCEKFISHVIHVGRYMTEEDLITCTKVIETRLAIGRLLESQARTLSMTSLKPLAFTTLAGKRLFLQAREAILLSTIKHLRQAVCADIA